MNFRRKASTFFQNLADYLSPIRPPLFVPDSLTGELHPVTSHEMQKRHNDLERYMSEYMPDHVVVMEKIEGHYQPVAMHRSAVAHLNTLEPMPEKVYNPKP